MKKSEIKRIQSALSEVGSNTLVIDGVLGPNTLSAIHSYLDEHAAELEGQLWEQWSQSRKAIAVLQLLCRENGIDSGTIDGLYGPQTESASEQLAHIQQHGSAPRSFNDIQPVHKNPNHFPNENYEQLVAHYGAPCEAPLVRVPCPWTLQLDWDLKSKTQVISIHEKLGDSLVRILSAIYAHYGDDGIKKHGLHRYGGSYNCRKKRGSTTAWSTHAWGIAIDWFPSQNKLSWRSDRASLAHPDLDAFWQIWEEEGWLSLGRTEDRDWMHVQAAKR